MDFLRQIIMSLLLYLSVNDPWNENHQYFETWTVHYILKMMLEKKIVFLKCFNFFFFKIYYFLRNYKFKTNYGKKITQWERWISWCFWDWPKNIFVNSNLFVFLKHFLKNLILTNIKNYYLFIFVFIKVEMKWIMWRMEFIWKFTVTK